MTVIPDIMVQISRLNQSFKLESHGPSKTIMFEDWDMSSTHNLLELCIDLTRLYEDFKNCKKHIMPSRNGFMYVLQKFFLWPSRELKVVKYFKNLTCMSQAEMCSVHLI